MSLFYIKICFISIETQIIHNYISSEELALFNSYYNVFSLVENRMNTK